MTFAAQILIGVLLTTVLVHAKIRGAPPSFDASSVSCAPYHRPSAPQIRVDTERINDDFCDCADGSDEPGTSACANGRFYCNSKFIPSAWVDDGVCDCCDGSDEPAERCPDTCAADLLKAQKEARAKARNIMAGVRKRKSMANNAVNIARDEKKQLNKYQKELKDVTRKLERCKTHESSLRARQSASRMTEQKTKVEDDNHVPADPDEDEFDHESEPIDDDMADEDEKMDDEDSADAPELEEESAGEGDAYKSQTPESESIEKPDTMTAPEADKMVSENADNTSETMQIDLEPFCQELGLGRGNTIMLKARTMALKAIARISWISPKILDRIGLSQPKELDKCIERVEEQRSDLESKKSDIENEISKIEKKEKALYGTDGALRELVGQCFKKKLTQYEWEHCLYEDVKQHENGRYIASLGNFDKLEGTTLFYNNGAYCWNGPDRSVTVKLVCGKHNEIVSVDEPNRCTYHMVFATPAVCEEDEAKRILRDVGLGDEVKDEL